MEEYTNVINENKSQSILSKMFLWLFMGLFATGIISWICYSKGLTYSMAVNGAFPILCIVELAVVIIFSLLFRKLSPTFVAILYFVYAIINGVSISTIFYVFDITSIATVFLVSALLFGVFAFLGAKTKVDLTKIGNILLGILVACLIVSLLNIFLFKSTMADILIDWILIVVFFGVTAYDVQKMLNMSEYGIISEDKIHIYGAMEIYLDFINIFLRLLSIFGRSKD